MKKTFVKRGNTITFHLTDDDIDILRHLYQQQEASNGVKVTRVTAKNIAEMAYACFDEGKESAIAQWDGLGFNDHNDTGG